MTRQRYSLNTPLGRITVPASDRAEAGRKIAREYEDRRRDRAMGVVVRRRNRETGTEIVLVDRNLVDGGPEGDGNDARWQVECVDHGSVCSMDTRAQGEAFMAEPTTWCEDCQAAHSTAGKGSWNDFDHDEEGT